VWGSAAAGGVLLPHIPAGDMARLDAKEDARFLDTLKALGVFHKLD